MESNKRKEFNPEDIGFILDSDAETIRDLEKIAAEAFLAREFPPRMLCADKR